jgi:flagellar basal-body rod modification protein FlgD
MILNHAAHAMGANTVTLAPSAPMAGPANGGNGGQTNPSSSSATISANDFLTLLVTEMQNQDPTADTDPNEYINQLVNVNSLEQLIDINQNLSTALGIPSSSSSQSASVTQMPATGPSAETSAAKGAVEMGQAAAKSSVPGTLEAAAASRANPFGAIESAVKAQAPGNLSVPEAKPAAHRVAEALGGHVKAH